MRRIDQMGLVNYIVKYISKTHAGILTRQFNTVIKCADAIIEEMESAYKPAFAGMGVKAWLTCDDTGLSSKFMAGINPEPDIPHDAADFGRCYLFDKAVNGMWNRERVRSASAQWERIIDAWDELCMMHEQKRFSDLNMWFAKNATEESQG